MKEKSTKRNKYRILSLERYILLTDQMVKVLSLKLLVKRIASAFYLVRCSMKNILILLGIFGWLSVFAEATAPKKTRWVLASDFNSTELASLSLEQEHELHLKSLSQKDPVTLAFAFCLELVAKSIGSDVFGFPADENTNRNNNAIAKATFDSFTKLHLQDRILKLMRMAVKIGAASMNETGSTISSAFSLACSKIDDSLKNESIYTNLRDEFMKEGPTPPNKTYLYGIAKSEEDLRKAFAELSNDPLMKKLCVHFAYSFFVGEKDVVTSKSILELANVPGKLESVEKIYEQTVAEVVPLVKDVKPEELELNNVPLNINIRELQPILTEKLLSKIKENSELNGDFEPIHKRIHDEIFSPQLAFPLPPN